MGQCDSAPYGLETRMSLIAHFERAARRQNSSYC
jgi:hypothetical protein